MPLLYILNYLLLTEYPFNFPFKEIEIEFSGERILALKDKILIYSDKESKIYFLKENGEIYFIILIFGFEKGKTREVKDLTTDGNEIFILGEDKIIIYNIHGEFIKEFKIDEINPSMIRTYFPFGIFVLDENQNKITRYNIEGIKEESFIMEIYDKEITDFEIENGFIYVFYEDGSLFKYTLYGNKNNEVKIEKGKKFKIKDDLIFLLSDDKIKILKDYKLYDKIEIKTLDFFIQNDILYLLSDKIYLIKLWKFYLYFYF